MNVCDSVMDLPSKETTFLSHGRENSVKTFVTKLKYDLEESGFHLWLDSENTSSSELKNEALMMCKRLIAVLTKSYVMSKFCEEELFASSNKGKRILPVIYEDGWDDPSLSEGSMVLFKVSPVYTRWIMFRPGVDDYTESLRMLKLTLDLPLPGTLLKLLFLDLFCTRKALSRA